MTNNQNRFRFLIKSNNWLVRKAVSELSSGKYTLEEVKNLHRMLDEFASKSRMESTLLEAWGRGYAGRLDSQRCAGKKMGIYTKVPYHGPL